MDSRGTSQDELISLVPDFSVDTSTLANMESFFSRISETLQKQKDDLLEETNDLRAELSDGFDKMIEGSIGALAEGFSLSHFILAVYQPRSGKKEKKSDCLESEGFVGNLNRVFPVSNGPHHGADGVNVLYDYICLLMDGLEKEEFSVIYHRY